jgi:ABC-type glycerol-3-phosphate transport system permease component
MFGRLSPSKIIGFLALCLLAALFVMPFLWMLGTSLTPAAEVIRIDRPILPRHPAWGIIMKRSPSCLSRSF